MLRLSFHNFSSCSFNKQRAADASKQAQLLTTFLFSTDLHLRPTLSFKVVPNESVNLCFNVLNDFTWLLNTWITPVRSAFPLCSVQHEVCPSPTSQDIHGTSPTSFAPKGRPGEPPRRPSLRTQLFESQAMETGSVSLGALYFKQKSQYLHRSCQSHYLRHFSSFHHRNQ